MPWTMLVVMVRALGVAGSIWRCHCVMSHCVSGPCTRYRSLLSSVSPRGIGAYTRVAGLSLVAFCISWLTFPCPPECCANPLVCALYILGQRVAPLHTEGGTSLVPIEVNQLCRMAGPSEAKLFIAQNLDPAGGPSFKGVRGTYLSQFLLMGLSPAGWPQPIRSPLSFGSE